MTVHDADYWQHAFNTAARALRDAERRVEAVRALHKPIRFIACDTGPLCELCDVAYPCPTVLALEGKAAE